MSVERSEADMESIHRQAPTGLIPILHPHIPSMTQWQPPKREPAKTKAELREMLAEAVRNTQAENKRLQQAKRVKAA
jgi:hypothetical protein